jgi:hypothetical protein
MGDSKNQSSDDWQPATSRPGELYTYEGQIRSVGSFFRGLHNKDPRQKAYRRPMQRVALLCVAIAVAVVAIAILAQALF